MNFDETIRKAIKQAETMQYGTLSIMFKKEVGRVNAIDLTQTTGHKVLGNAEALTLVGTMLKMLASSGESGSLSFTITIDKGKSSRLLVNDFRRISVDHTKS